MSQAQANIPCQPPKRRRALRFTVMLGLLLISSCKNNDGEQSAAAQGSVASGGNPTSSAQAPSAQAAQVEALSAPSASAAAALEPIEPDAARLERIIVAEYARDASAIKNPDLIHPKLEIRVAATRALARIASEASYEHLIARLSDAEPEVLSWAAYGLGYLCGNNAYSTTRALVSRAASLGLAQAELQNTPPALEPFSALADALARCGGVEAEASLRAWLRSPIKGLSREASLALARLASRSGQLHGETIVALLELASSETAPSEALAPFAHIAPPNASVAKRIREVATQALDRPNPAYAIRALGRNEAEAASELHRIVIDSKRSGAERIDAAKGLAQLKRGAAEAITDALKTLAPTQEAISKQLTGEAFILLSELIKGIDPSFAPAKSPLQLFASLPLSGGEALKQRAIQLRCAAAEKIANTRTLNESLTSCDPEGGHIGALSTLAVLDRAPITRARLTTWLKYSEAADRRVRQAALALLANHPEIEQQPKFLALALSAEEPGTVATAAQLIHSHPDRVMITRQDGFRPEPRIEQALKAAHEKFADGNHLETQAALINATAAMQLKAQIGLVKAYCSSPNITLRTHAIKALQALGEPRSACEYNPSPGAGAKAPSAATNNISLEFLVENPANHESPKRLLIQLDVARAPLASQRIAELAKSHFYDGIKIHRVVPGFVIQFGDPNGDSYGGAPGGAIPCETTPLPFKRYRVGLALSGRDTGSSQLFVTLGDHPHLDGNYPLLGEASGDWDQLAVGDTIQSVKVLETKRL